MNHRRRPGGHAPGSLRPGLRERNKEKKLEAIVRAGRALFVRKGFDETTTREIAARAEVAAGTFFLYFREKRDLLFHVFEEEIAAVQEKAFASVPARASLARQLGHIFSRFHAYYAKDVRLSRVFMKELLFLEKGRSDDILAMTLAFVGRVAELVARARERGEVDPSVDPLQVAAHAFALYLFGVIGFLNGGLPTVESVRTQLEDQLEMLMRGVGSKQRHRDG